MKPVSSFALALALALLLQPVCAQAQSPITPLPSSAIQPLRPSPPVWPEGGGGLCQCGYLGGNAVTTDRPFEKNVLGLTCMSAVEQCKSACGSTTGFRYVPYAAFTCPTRPGETVGPVALNAARTRLR
jgi:hypothetical protein